MPLQQGSTVGRFLHIIYVGG